MRLLLLLLWGMQVAIQKGTDTSVVRPLKPPPALTDDVVTNYFGVQVSDPYRWMEAGGGDPRVMRFLQSQNDYAMSMLASLGDSRAKLLSRILELDSQVSNVRSWQRAAGSTFYLEIAPGADTPSLMMRKSGGISRKLLDSTQFDEKGTHATIDFFSPSIDGRLVLLGVSLGGSENSTIRIVNSETGRLLPDVITRTQYAFPAWRLDSRSFYYTRLQKLPTDALPTALYENPRVHLHIVGSDPESDPAVFGSGVSETVSIPKAGFVGAITDPESEYTLAYFSKGTTDPTSLYAIPTARIRDSVLEWHKIVSPEDQLSPYSPSPFAIHGSTLYLLVEKDAPNRKVVSIDLHHPDFAHAQVVVPMSHIVLRAIYAAEDGLYVMGNIGPNFSLHRVPYGTAAQPQTVKLPYVGTISKVDANVLLPGVVFRLESWTRADQILAYDPSTNRVTDTGLARKNPVDFSGVEARETRARSADGTMVPVSIVCKKSLSMDGSHPALLEAYGAYGISSDAFFNPSILAWLERGGVFAIAHARGGGEYGENWHNAGRKQTKQHTIDDVIAAAQFLIEARYTSSKRLAIRGTSAGGVAVGGVLFQRPELFAVAIDNGGMTDLLRFQTTQGGAANIPELGDVTDPEGFKNLYAVSAYHHVLNGTNYPATLGITGVNDPRVPPWVVGKMIARLQAATSSGRPVLLRVDFDAGHGMGSSRSQRNEQLADEISFVLWQTGDAEFQPKSGIPDD